MLEIGSDQVRGDIVVDDFNAMEKISQKGTDLGSVKKALDALKFSTTDYQNRVSLSYEYDLGENLTSKNLL